MLVDHFFGVDDGTDLNVGIADDEDSAVIAFFLMGHVVRCRAMSCEVVRKLFFQHAWLDRDRFFVLKDRVRMRKNDSKK